MGSAPNAVEQVVHRGAGRRGAALKNLANRLFAALQRRIRGWAAPRARALRIEQSIALGERRSVVVLQWEDRRYLLGVTPQAVQVLDARAASREMVQEPCDGVLA